MICFKYKTEKHEFTHLKTSNDQAPIKRIDENIHLKKHKTQEK